MRTGRASVFHRFEAGGTVPSLVERSALLILRGAPPADVAEIGAMSLRTAHRWRRDLVAIERVTVDGWSAVFARRRRRPPVRIGPWERSEGR